MSVILIYFSNFFFIPVGGKPISEALSFLPYEKATVFVYIIMFRNIYDYRQLVYNFIIFISTNIRFI